MQTGAFIYERTSTERMRSVKISPDGNKILVHVDGQVELMMMDSGARFHHFDRLDSPARSIAIDHAGCIVAMGCDDGRVALFDLRVDDGIPQWTAKQSGRVSAVAVSPDAAYVAAGDDANSVRVYETATGVVVWSKISSWDGNESAQLTGGLCFSGDSSMLAVGRWDTYAYLVETRNWTISGSVSRADRVCTVSLDHPGRRMAVGGRFKKAEVFSIGLTQTKPGWGKIKKSVVSASMERTARFGLIFSVQLDSIVNSVALVPDGKILAVGCVETAINIYSVNAKRLVHSLSHGGAVQELAFSPDAKHLIVGGAHKSVCVWRVSGHGQPEHELVLPRNSEISSVAFSGVSIGFVSSSRASIYGRGNDDYEVSLKQYVY